jgi:ADP-heptose:LPS heptosyltransferase
MRAYDAQELINAKNPVVFFANGFGDAILALPALRALTALFPNRLTLIAQTAKYVDLFQCLPTKEQFFITATKKKFWETAETERVAQAIVSKETQACDLFIAMVPWNSSSLAHMVEKLNPETTVGFFHEYDVFLPLDYSIHSAKLNFEVVKMLSPDCTFESFLSPLSYPAAASGLASDIKRRLASGARLLAVHTETLSDKMWELKNFAAVLNRFLAENPEHLAIVVDDKSCLPPLIEDGVQSRFINGTGLGLIDALCLVQSADLFLGIDSCMLHSADFGRVPAVGLFGPTKAHEFGFLAGPNITIQGRAAMSEIQPDLVLEALRSLVKNPAQDIVWHTT